MTFEEWQQKHGPNGGAYDIEMMRAGWDAATRIEREANSGNAEANRRLYKAMEDCQPFLKDGETPAECLARNRSDLDTALKLLAAEKKNKESYQAHSCDIEGCAVCDPCYGL